LARARASEVIRTKAVVHGLIAAAISFAFAEDGVERSSPNGAPTAFRIWRPGTNMTDMGAHVFSAESAKALMAEQARRGNKYSIDADHMSLNAISPPESRKAVGWHRLGLRGPEIGPELWAVDVEWTDAVRAGLEKPVPEWRYFSPAYKLGKGTSEIVSYLNTALTNNPATHFVTELATLQAANATARTSMDYKEMAGAFFGKDDEKRKDARDCYSKMSEAEKKAFKAAWKAAESDFGDDGGSAGAGGDDEKKKKEEDAKKAAESEEKKKEEEKQAATRAASEAQKAALAAAKPSDREIQLASRVDSLESAIKERDARDKTEADRKERETIFAKRPDIGANVRASLAALPTADLKKFVEAMPRVHASPDAAANAITAGGGVTGGERQPGTVNPTLSRLTRDERVMLASVTANLPPTGDIVRATRRGTTLEMPVHIPTPTQITNRIKELEADLAAHRAEYLQ
jgi:hypothetical protein